MLEAISIVQEDIARDLYDRVASHQEEITRLIQEFDKHEIDTSVHLDAYEQTRRSQTPKLGATIYPQPPTTPHKADEEEAGDTDSEEGHQGEPSLFNIL